MRIPTLVALLVCLEAPTVGQEPIRVLTLDATRTSVCPSASLDYNILTGNAFSRVREILSDPAHFGPGGVVGRSIAFLPQVPAITPDALATADVVLLCRNDPHLTLCESLELADFVRQGGGLFAFHNWAAAWPGEAFGAVMNQTGQGGASATVSDQGSPLVTGPFGSVVGSLSFPYHHVFEELGPNGHEVLATRGPLCATFDVGAGRAVLIGDEEWCHSGPGASECGHGWLPNAPRETLFMNCVAAVTPPPDFVYFPTQPCVIRYCTGTPNSTGVDARLTTHGSASVVANDLELVCSDLPTSVFGVFVCGAARTQVPFGGGYLCVQPPLNYLMPSSLSRLGTLNHSLDLASLPAAFAVLPGSTSFIQAFYRDFGGPFGSRFNTSSALEIAWAP